MVGEIIAEAMDKVGKEGVITVEESNTFGLDLELTEGMRFDKGYSLAYFVTTRSAWRPSSRTTCCLAEPEDLLGQGPAAAAREGHAACSSGRRRGPVHAGRGNFPGHLQSAAVKAPGFRRKAMLQDIAILTVARSSPRRSASASSSAGIELLGQARKVVITKDETTIEGSGDADQIAGQAQPDPRRDRELYHTVTARSRTSAWPSGWRRRGDQGAATEVEAQQRKHRIEDAVRNAKAAVEEGNPAAGTGGPTADAAFAKLDLTGDEATGAKIVRFATEAPLKQIAINAWLEGGVVAEKVRNLTPGHGLNAATGGVRRHDRRGHHRPRQGDALRSAERRVDRRERRGCRGRQAERAAPWPATPPADGWHGLLIHPP